MTLPVPMGSEDERAKCFHQWKRWPVVSLSAGYTCARCGEPESITWAAGHAGKSIADLDRLLVERRGGVFAGEAWTSPPPPSPSLRS